MLKFFGIIFLLQLVGEALAQVFAVPIPGAVLALILLLLILVIRGKRLRGGLNRQADSFLRYLSLLYVPVGVGIMTYYRQIVADWLPLLAVILVSTVITQFLVALLLKGLVRRGRRGVSCD